MHSAHCQKQHRGSGEYKSCPSAVNVCVAAAFYLSITSSIDIVLLVIVTPVSHLEA